MARELFFYQRWPRTTAKARMLQNPDNRPAGDVPPPVDLLPDGSIRLVDQSLLPSQFEFIVCSTIEELAGAIRSLKVRGAPAIGIAAAYGLCLVSTLSSAADVDQLLSDLDYAAITLRQTRPTAVNLAWALDKVLGRARAERARGLAAVRRAVFDEAGQIDDDNSRANLLIGAHGASLIEDGMNILTHCNAGPLAAGGIGTALGAIYTAHCQGKKLHVWVDETRPLLQGARITAWELQRWGIPCTLIADNMAASVMRAGRVDAVITGGDRIAANGDTANKIGTYSVAVLASAHRIPYYAVVPTSTIDLSIANGDEIKIEERNPDEITHHGGTRLAPEGVAVYNPAFDVTPAALVTAIVTESGVARAPYAQSLRLAWDLAHPHAGRGDAA